MAQAQANKYAFKGASVTLLAVKFLIRGLKGTSLFEQVLPLQAE